MTAEIERGKDIDSEATGIVAAIVSVTTGASFFCPETSARGESQSRGSARGGVRGAGGAEKRIGRREGKRKAVWEL